jgi:hypothetical protein
MFDPGVKFGIQGAGFMMALQDAVSGLCFLTVVIY